MSMRFRHLALSAATLSMLCLLPACDDSSDPAGGDAGAAGQGGAGNTGGTAGIGGAAGGGGDNGGPCTGDEMCAAGARCDVAGGVCRPTCDLDEQCGSSARCGAQGFCVPLVSCAEDGVCGADEVCSCRGVCEPVVGRACPGGPLQCAVDEYCDACTVSCQPRVLPCGRCSAVALGDAAVNPCERQDNDACLPVGAAGLSYCLRGCGNQSTCDRVGPGYVCNGDGLCVPESGECSALGGCAVDGDCQVGFFCNERLSCQPGCEGDTSCPGDQVCVGVRCQPPCVADPDCGPNAHCDAGHCRVDGGCFTSADCLEPETHCDVPTQMCAPGCERDDDCMDATKECVGTECRPRGCTGNYQCAFGEVCDLPSAQCVMAEGRHCEVDCDPEQSETSCGETGQRCLSLQDEDENPLGDFCFEPCQPSPNECPQGYSCIELEDQDGNVDARLCVRRCDLDPLR